jgi:hypothetical protein
MPPPLRASREYRYGRVSNRKIAARCPDVPRDLVNCRQSPDYHNLNNKFCLQSARSTTNAKRAADPKLARLLQGNPRPYRLQDFGVMRFPASPSHFPCVPLLKEDVGGNIGRPRRTLRKPSLRYPWTLRTLLRCDLQSSCVK